MIIEKNNSIWFKKMMDISQNYPENTKENWKK